MTAVMIATPAYGGNNTIHYTMSLAATLVEFRQAGIDSAVNMGAFSQVHAARNFMAAQFLAEPSLTHLMFIDADIGWPPGSIQRLLSHDQPVVCGMYPNKRPECDFAFFPVQGSTVYGDPQNGLRVEIEYALGGFLLIRRDVFERLAQAMPELKLQGASQGGHFGPRLAPFCYDFFPTVREDGVLWSEDYGFSRLWRSIGGQIWLDPTIVLTHVGTHAFQGDPMAAVRIGEFVGAERAA